MSVSRFEKALLDAIQETKDAAFGSIPPGATHDWTAAQAKVFGIEFALEKYREMKRRADEEVD